MEIILVRHGKAEEKSENLEDKKRHLTEEGKEIYQNLMPELKEKLGPLAERNLLLWSSPANRAQETAEIVGNALQLEISSIEDFIYEGDFEELSTRIQNTDDGTTLMVVGHEPSLSEWTKKMADEELKIRKGDMLYFKVVQKAPLEAKLQWVISVKN